MRTASFVLVKIYRVDASAYSTDPVRMPLKRFIYLLIGQLLFTASVYTTHSHADEVYTFIVKKQEEKKKYSTYLSDWFDTKEKMRIMDLWLALHSPSPYEFYFQGAWLPGIQGSSVKDDGQRYSFGAYASLFGLEIERQSFIETRTQGLFRLRAFGYHHQGTHLRLEAGLQQVDPLQGTPFRNAVAGVGLTAYIARHFGITGLYHYRFDPTPASASTSLKGKRYEVGGFIEFEFLRVYGNYNYEITSTEIRTCPELGFQFFL